MVSVDENDEVRVRSKVCLTFGAELYFIEGWSGKAPLRRWHLCRV